ncbi:MAG TPA: efflux RND transporter permease subunit [Longimicrobiales bacterium]|nr:efflux RND transporter permease subunit [Longimicrobiales bacterium]
MEPDRPRDHRDIPEGGPASDPDFLSRFKEFGPTSFAVDHGTSILVLLFIVTIMGFLSYRTTPKEAFPEIEVPMVIVNTVYPGVSPADVESLISRPLEDELSTISDVKELISSSVEGHSSLTVEFETTVAIEDALASVREKVDLAKPDLPADAEDPAIVEFSMSEVPIMQVNLSGDYGLVRLKEIGEEMQDRLEQIPSILRVDLRGGLEREVQVDVDLRKLQFYGLALNDVTDAIREEHVNIPGGSIDVGESKYLVRVDGEFSDPALIEDLVVTADNGRPVYVRDVATVDFGFAERESFARLDGTDVVTLDIIKRSGRNIIETSDQVKRVVDEMGPLMPPSTVVKITSDQSRDIRMMVSSLENNIVSGLLLIVGVLLFFLGLTNSGFVGISIPASMLLSFVVLRMLGTTMNMVVLFSLILALGMLVDNAIVVVENIYRYMEEGWDRKWAAKKATGEVAMPVIAATLTTLAAFGPLLFWPGTTGEFMKFLPTTLIVTLSSSLFVALVIIPSLCAMFMRLEDEPRKGLRPAARITLVAAGVLLLAFVARANLLTAGLLALTGLLVWAFFHFVLNRVARDFQDRFVPTMISFYERQLRWALDHRAVILGLSATAFVVTVPLFVAFNHGVEFFPEDIPPKDVFVDVETPVGTRAAATDAHLRRLEAELLEAPGREDWASRVAISGGGGGSAAAGAMGQGGPSGPDRGRTTISLVDFQDRENDAFELLAWMQENVGTEVAGAEVTVEARQEGVSDAPPVNIEIVGDDPAVLQELSDQVLAHLRADPVFPKLLGLESDLDQARPELSVRVDREKAALFDLSTMDVGQAIRGAIDGIEAAKYRDGNDEYDIVVRLAPEFRQELDQLGQLTVVAEGGAQIPLSSVADWSVGEGLGSIRRKDQTRMATISSDVAAGLNSNAVLAEVRASLADFAENELPPGYTLQYTGEQTEQAEAQSFLLGAFLTALFLIGFILVSQFNSVVKPVIILTSVLMSTVGVLLGLLLFQMPFGIIMTGVGIISLAGIVVNNAIVLIDYIDILRDRDGMDRREALVVGGKTRFRPVVLTATTTALGLVPLAIGLNFDFFGLYGSLTPELYWGGEQAAWWGPMAVAVIAGIIFATFLTLILVPVLYSLVDDATKLFRRYFTHADEAQVDVTDAGAADAEEETPAAEAPPVPEPRRKPEPAPVFRSTLSGPELQPE